MTLQIQPAADRDRLTHQSGTELTGCRSGTGSVKKIHTWAPTRDREISSAAGAPIARAALR